MIASERVKRPRIGSQHDHDAISDLHTTRLGPQSISTTGGFTSVVSGLDPRNDTSQSQTGTAQSRDDNTNTTAENPVTTGAAQPNLSAPNKHGLNTQEQQQLNAPAAQQLNAPAAQSHDDATIRTASNPTFWWRNSFQTSVPHPNPAEQPNRDASNTQEEQLNAPAATAPSAAATELSVPPQNDNEQTFQRQIESNCRLTVGAKCRRGCNRCINDQVQASFRAAMFIGNLCIIRAKDSTATQMGRYVCLLCSPKTSNSALSMGNMWSHVMGDSHYGKALEAAGHDISQLDVKAQFKSWMCSMGLKSKAQATAERKELQQPTHQRRHPFTQPAPMPMHPVSAPMLTQPMPTAPAPVPATPPVMTAPSAMTAPTVTQQLPSFGLLVPPATAVSAPTPNQQTPNVVPAAVPGTLAPLAGWLNQLSGMTNPHHTRA